MPALNWRQVSLDRITVLLPCKPDRAQRSLRLGERDVTISMAGCEADGTLFAVSHIHQRDSGAAASVAREWRAATLTNIHATSTTEVPMRPVPGTATTTRLSAQGVRPDATTLQAHLAWLVAGDDVFHLAVYGSRLTPELADSLFSDIKIQ
ncbi:MAG: hypothetical protein KGN32_15675 [Burkholderiales bacterium]|nr:hypothetical protein [Burkholderiales bacterium]